MNIGIKWFVEHPIWTFIGSVLGIIGIIGTVQTWIVKPIDPELEALEVLLRDVSTEAAYIANFSSYSSNEKENMLGGINGWQSSVLNRISYAQQAVENITNSNGYSKITEQGRKVFNVSNSRLDKYKDKKYLNMRTPALYQHACGLIINSIRELANIKEKKELTECMPIVGKCREALVLYGKEIKIETGGC